MGGIAIDVKDTQRVKVAGMLNYMDVEYFLVKPEPIQSKNWEMLETLRWEAVRAVPVGFTKRPDAVILTTANDIPVYPSPADVVVYLGGSQKFLVDYEVCTRNLEIVCRLPKTNSDTQE